MKRDISGYFGLSYSSYLVLHRVALEAMPDDWQDRFVQMLEEMERAIDYEKMPRTFRVQPTVKGRFAHDPFADYRRGRAPLRVGGSS